MKTDIKLVYLLTGFRPTFTEMLVKTVNRLRFS